MRFAMEFGLPPEEAERPTFFMHPTDTTTAEVDDEGVPYDATASVTKGALTSHRVDCAVEYVDGDGKIESFAIVAPSKVKLTLLDEEFAIVEGFWYVVIKGQKYYYQRSEPVIGLGSIGVHTIHCRSEDEG